MALLDERTILITGGAGGLGLACARKAMESGAEVVVADLPGDRLSAAEDELRAAGQVRAIAADLSTMETAAEVVDRAREATSTGRIDGLVSAVGVMHTEPLRTASHDQWRRTMAVNLDAVFATLRAAANDMSEAGGGSIVTISSVAARAGRPAAADYAASKSALLSLTKSAALAYAPDVRVNAVCPGVVWTRMWEQIVADRDETYGPGAGRTYLDEVSARTPLRRLGHPSEIADAVVYLLSDAATFVTGQALNVDGGLEMD